MRFTAVALVLLLTSFTVQAQQDKVARIGILGARSAQPLYAEFLQELLALGYAEGKNVVIEWRDPAGNPARAAELAAELVRLNVDVIVAAASANATAARRATSTIPIVTQSADPVAEGLVGSLSRPGGNITGLSTQSSDVIGKQLELLKQMLPRLSRVAILWNPGIAFHAVQAKQAAVAARALGAQPHLVPARSASDLEGAFDEAAKARADALLILVDGTVFLPNRAKIADLASKRRLPAMHPRKEDVDSGGLISYGADRRDLYRRMASYVDKVLKGAKPAELPIEQPTRFELVINLKTAKMIGLTIPARLLQRADQVIQ